MLSCGGGEGRVVTNKSASRRARSAERAATGRLRSHEHSTHVTTPLTTLALTTSPGLKLLQICVPPSHRMISIRHRQFHNPDTARALSAHLDSILCGLPDVLRPDDALELWPARLAVDGEEREGGGDAGHPRDGPDHDRVGRRDRLRVVLADDGDFLGGVQVEVVGSGGRGCEQGDGLGVGVGGAKGGRLRRGAEDAKQSALGRMITRD